MCGRFALFSLEPEFFAELGIGELPAGLAARWNIAPSQRAAVVREQAGRRELGLLRWGLVPHWSRDEKIGNRLINARVETVSEKPAFREAFHRRRCLVPADGFYEWQKVGSRKQPHFIAAPGGRPLLLGGLWDRWEKGPEPLESFTIVTAPAGPALAAIHGRMPLVLRPEDAPGWLAGPAPAARRLEQLAARARDIPLTTRPVSTLVNNPANEGAELVLMGS